jgi:integrase
MPLKLVPPRKNWSPNWKIRGTYLGVYVDRSSGTDRKAIALRRLKDLEGTIERGEYPEKQPIADAPTFLSAAVAYMHAGGERANVEKLINHFGETLLSDINQQAIDAAAVALFPAVTPATRNRKVYTPVSAILRHAGVELRIKRPKGSKGRQKIDFLSPEDAEAIIAAAYAREPPFALLLRTLLYTGMRIGEALALRWENMAIDQRFATVGTTKNGDPRTMLLREDLRILLLVHRGEKTHGPVFEFRRGGGLKDRLVRARMEASDVDVPRRTNGTSRKPPPHRLSWVTFHTFRHTWATWMRRYGGLDEIGLVATGNWRDPHSARRYAHTVARDEWSRVDSLPTIGHKR